MPERAFVGPQCSKAKHRPISPTGRGFRAPCPGGRGSTRAPQRPKGLRKRLHAARDMAAALPSSGGAYAYAAPSVGPDLKVWAVPQHGEDSLRAPGLVSTPKFAKRVRPGLSGISTAGRKVIRQSAALMEDFRSRCAMWTVTLTDNDYLSLASAGEWPNFQRRIVDLLIRHLKAHGDEAVVLAVVEVGSKRFSRTGRPDPHIHVLTTGWGRKDKEGRWLLRPDVCDQLVAKACQYAGLPSAERPACSNVSRVRTSVSSYLSKYLTKTPSSGASFGSDEWHELIPRQWWNRSESCKAMLEGCMTKLPPAFAAFLVRHQILLERMELGRAGTRVVGWKKTKLAELPIEAWRFVFRSPEALMQGMELFALWVDNDEQLDVGRLVMSG